MYWFSYFDIKDSIVFPEFAVCGAHDIGIFCSLSNIYSYTQCLKENLVKVTTICGILKNNGVYYFL